jgi:hypothetical protein
MRYHELTESESWNVEIPPLFYRGSTEATRSAYLTKLWRRPDPELPEAINRLLIDGRTSRVSGLSFNTPFRISRTYQGMSNWGFGVYFAANLDWALSYGTSITVVRVDPNEILAIRADDFAQRIEGTSGGELRQRLTRKAGNIGMQEEARVMGSVVRSMKRGAKALYVDAQNTSQICVFGVTAIIPKYYFEIES